MNNTCKILVLNKNKDTLNVLKNKLLSGGCTVYKASDEIDGLKKVYAYKPDIILVDIAFASYFEGVEMLREFVRNPDFEKIKIILLNVANPAKAIGKLILGSTRVFNQQSIDKQDKALLIQDSSKLAFLQENETSSQLQENEYSIHSLNNEFVIEEIKELIT